VAEEPPDTNEILDGDFTFPDGSFYRGEYVLRSGKPVMHGNGRLETGPEVFKGSFEEGQFREGRYSGSDGSVYKGSFFNDKFHGRGEYTWTDGRLFKGMWKDGLMHGRGEFVNFSFGADRVFQGFCVHGHFSSSLEGQENARRDFLAEYGTAFAQSATCALSRLSSLVGPAEVDPKAKKGAVEDVPVEIPSEFAVPADQEDVKSAERAEIEQQFCRGPFPDGPVFKATALAAFAANFADGAENPGEVKVVEGSGNEQFGGFDTSRLVSEQLNYAGQAVVFATPDAEGGALCRLVLVNASSGGDADKANWKVVFCEDVAVAA